MLRSTSLHAYEQIRGKLSKSEGEVYAVLEGKMTIKEVARLMGQENGWVSARINGLVKKKRVVEDGKMFCPVTGNRVIAWRRADVSVEIRKPVGNSQQALFTIPKEYNV